MSRPFRTCALVALLVISSALCLPRPVQARVRAKALVGKVSLRPAALPGRKGTARYLEALKKSSGGRAVFRENRKTGEWTIHYAAVARRPVQGVRVTIYDISNGTRLVGSHDQMMYKRSRILAGTLKLARDQIFSPNARLRIVFESLGGRMLAHRRFYIQGREAAANKKRRVTNLDFSGPDGGGDDDRITVGALSRMRRSRR